MKIHYSQCDEERVMKLHRDGVSVANIARRMGVSRTTVHKVIKRHEEGRDAKPGRD